MTVSRFRRQFLALAALACAVPCANAQGCGVRSGDSITPVVELYTSEGCSSCPPADQWLSSLRSRDAGGGPVVIQAFHVAYWDYIGWVDRFANPAHTARQRQIAQWNGQRSIYTPQLAMNGADWRDWHRAGSVLPAGNRAARAAIDVQQIAPDRFEATVRVLATTPSQWGAYWTVTEQGHSSAVKAGENAGEFLRHAHLVRQYTAVGDYRSDPQQPQRLLFRALAPSAGHERRINLVVFDRGTGHTLQAVTLAC